MLRDMIYRFTAVIEKEGKYYIARALQLGVVSQGKTVEEAEANLREAVELFLEDEKVPKEELSQSAPLVTTLEVQ